MTMPANADLAADFTEDTIAYGAVSQPSRTKPALSTDRHRRLYSGVIGGLFLLGFLSYGSGFALVSSVVGVPDFLSTISTHQTTLILGAFLMLLNSMVDVGKGVLFFPIVENHGKRTALAYLAAMILEVALLAIGILCLLMIPAIGQYAADVGGANVGWANGLATLLTQSNTMAYTLAMMTLSAGNVFLWSLTFRARLLPRWLSAWGIVGYVIFFAGATAEVFGTPLSLMASIPGGLFEVALGLWLIFKGFEPNAYGKASA